MDTPNLEVIKSFTDLVSSAIGTLYKPYGMKRLAKADAEIIKTLAPVIRQNNDLPITIEINGLKMSSPEIKTLSERTIKRMIYTEVRRQINMEKIADYAYDDIKQQETIPVNDISTDWINRFFNYASDINEEDMQKLWGKLLAGEVKNPSSFSYRTMEILHNMSTEEAKLFERACSFICCRSMIINSPALANHGLPYTDILRLSECGLLNNDSLASIKLPLPNKDKIILDFANCVIVSDSVPQNLDMHIYVYTLTHTAIELYSIVGFRNADKSYLEDVVKDLSPYQEKCKFAIKEITRIDDLHFYWGEVIVSPAKSSKT